MVSTSKEDQASAQHTNCNPSVGFIAGSVLASLDLSDNPLTEEAGESLGHMLSEQGQLLTLDLSDTALGKEGLVQVVAGSKTGCPLLEELGLSMNDLPAWSMQVRDPPPPPPPDPSCMWSFQR